MPPRNRKDMSDDLKLAIASLVKSGMSYREISKKLKVSTGAISAIMKKMHSSGTCSSMRKNCGPKIRATKTDLRSLQLMVRRSPTKSSKVLQVEMQNRGLAVGSSTIRRYLKKMGLICRVAPRKPLLTRRHRKLRLAFARKYVGKDESFWRKVLFTDETRLAIRNDSSRVHVRRKSGERLNFSTPTVKHPASVMMWGCFSASGVGRIRFLDKGETCNTAWYLKVLDNQVKWSARDLFLDEDFVLQDDGAPCHRSKPVKDFIRNRGWQVLDWPPQSPDLNPIENLWALVKRRVWTQNFSKTVDLRAKIIHVWFHQLDKQLLETLALSMKNRLLDVIKAKGGVTKY